MKVKLEAQNIMPKVELIDALTAGDQQRACAIVDGYPDLAGELFDDPSDTGVSTI